MKKLQLIAAGLVLSTLLSCAPYTSIPSNTIPEDTAVDTALPVNETAVPMEENTPTPTLPSIPFITAPEEGTPGAFFIDSYEGLAALANNEEFLTYPDRPIVCITASFYMEEPIYLDRAVDIVYLSSQCLWEYPLTVRGGNCPFLRVTTECTAILTLGQLLIDAPYASLEVIGAALPAGDKLFLYCNVAAYNGLKKEVAWGGVGSDTLTGVALLNSKTKVPYEGVFLSLTGNTAEIAFPLIVSEKDWTEASLTFTTSEGSTVSYEKMDLTEENVVTVTDAAGRARVYRLTGRRLSYDLPVMEIHTEGSEPIVEKNTYLHGTLTLDGTSYSMRIRGRGNASWMYFPKKAYRIKLDEKASLFGLPENKDWVLASNYPDKTMIRNCVAHTVASSLSGLLYTPTHFPVNLYLNGEYLGVYTFADKIEDGKGRLDLGNLTLSDKNDDIGFLVEIGWDFDKENEYNKDYFDAEKVLRIFVKEPEIPRANTPEFLFLKYYILNAEKAIIRNDGWENYIDVDSWIDWLIVNELTFNTESSFYRSCYLWRPEGGKLHLGPVWDFDMAFGNHAGDLPGYDGWCTTETTYEHIYNNWMTILMGYPAFTDRLVERWNEVKDSLLVTALDAVDTYSAMLEGSQQQNYLVWNNLNVYVGMASVNPYVYNTYDKQVDYLRDFISTRWSYIDNRLNSAEYVPGITDDEGPDAVETTVDAPAEETAGTETRAEETTLTETSAEETSTDETLGEETSTN